MIIEEALLLLLKTGGSDPPRQAAATDLAAIVGAGDSARIGPAIVSQAPGTAGKPKYPAVTYWRVDGPRAHSLTGPSGYAEPLFQFECWAHTYAVAKRMVNLVRQILDGFAGVVGTPPGAVDINGVLVRGDDDGYDEGEQVRVCTIDIKVMHNE